MINIEEDEKMRRILHLGLRASVALRDFSAPWQDGKGSIGAGLMELVCAIIQNEPLEVQPGTSLAYYLMSTYGFEADHWVWGYVNHEAISK